MVEDQRDPPLWMIESGSPSIRAVRILDLLVLRPGRVCLIPLGVFPLMATTRHHIQQRVMITCRNHFPSLIFLFGLVISTTSTTRKKRIRNCLRSSASLASLKSKSWVKTVIDMPMSISLGRKMPAKLNENCRTNLCLGETCGLSGHDQL